MRAKRIFLLQHGVSWTESGEFSIPQLDTLLQQFLGRAHTPATGRRFVPIHRKVSA